MAGNLISDRGVAQLRADHQKLQQMVQRHQLMNSAPAYQSPREDQIYVKLTTVITPKESGQLGEGVVTVYDIDSTGAIYQTNRDDITVYNTTSVPIPIGSYVMCRRNFKSGIWIADEPQTVIGYTSGGISARSGTNLGSGSVRLRYRKDDGTLGDIETEVEDGDNITYNVTVYNIADSNVDSNSHVMAKRNSMSGNWYVDFAEC